MAITQKDLKEHSASWDEYLTKPWDGGGAYQGDEYITGYLLTNRVIYNIWDDWENPYEDLRRRGILR